MHVLQLRPETDHMPCVVMVSNVQGSIRVFCRIRPIVDLEKAAGGAIDIIRTCALHSRKSMRSLLTLQTCFHGPIMRPQNRATPSGRCDASFQVVSQTSIALSLPEVLVHVWGWSQTHFLFPYHNRLPG